MPPTRIEVAASSGSYPVLIGSGTIEALDTTLDACDLGPRRFVISSPLVWDLHGKRFQRLLRGGEPILVPDGERFKHAATLGHVYDALIQRSADRATVIVAIGGGVIGDLVGFAAATFLRGLRLVHVPTTLMAQVDSAVGGKVGINHAAAKNLIGAFHPPRLVASDPGVLATLPRREFRAGLYEVIKYGVISTPALLDRMEGSLAALFARDPAMLSDIVTESCRIKAAIVSADERESGLRRVLNFGHTLGHALEAVTRYRRFRHGEAVAYGMLAALALGTARGVTANDVYQRVARLIAALGPLPPIGDLSARAILSAASHDKKTIGGTLHFIAAATLGQTTTLTDVSSSELRTALKSLGVKKA
ncbi:MAG: 3-dehydroquinate synthase [Acidobacteriota bacterium]